MCKKLATSTNFWDNLGDAEDMLGEEKKSPSQEKPIWYQIDIFQEEEENSRLDSEERAIQSDDNTGDQIHLGTCFNPNLMMKGEIPRAQSRKWCATSTSYTDIVRETEVTGPEDLGICPGETTDIKVTFIFDHTKC